MSGTRFENVYMAQLAEQAERWDDMVEYMKRIASMGAELSLDERNLLSVAYKNSVSMCRNALRQVKTMEIAVSSGGHSATDVEAIKGYYSRLEAELNDKCKEILELLGKDLLPTASTADGKVFFQKLKGDYHRYLSEFASGENFVKHSTEARDSYQAAMVLAEKDLPPQNPLRLGLALNFSVFLFEVMGVTEESYKLQAAVTAKKAYDDGLKTYTEDQPDASEALQILQLLRDNINLWTADSTAPPDDGTVTEDL